MPEFNDHSIAAAIRRELGKRYCSYGDASGEPCGASIINAHTVQKEGGLRAIARDGKVYSMIQTLAGLAQNGGKPKPRLTGIGDASVFSGFCSTHDNGLFKPIEGKTCVIGAWEALLFAYRAASFEAYYKRAQLAVAPLYFRRDEGLPVEEHEFVQNLARHYSHGVANGEHGTRARKAAYDRRLREKDLHDFGYAWARFDTVLPLVCCGTFLPDIDLNGTLLQRLAHGTATFEQVALNITSFSGQSVIVFGWAGASDGPASRFVSSFDDLDDGLKAHCAVRMAIEFLENTYLQPRWWDALTSFDHADLIRHSLKSLGPRTASVARALRERVPKLGDVAVTAKGSAFAPRL